MFHIFPARFEPHESYNVEVNYGRTLEDAARDVRLAYGRQEEDKITSENFPSVHREGTARLEVITGWFWCHGSYYYCGPLHHYGHFRDLRPGEVLQAIQKEGYRSTEPLEFIAFAKRYEGLVGFPVISMSPTSPGGNGAFPSVLCLYAQGLGLSHLEPDWGKVPKCQCPCTIKRGPFMFAVVREE